MKVLILADGLGPSAARGVEIIMETVESLARSKVKIVLLTTIDSLTNKTEWSKWRKDQEEKFNIQIEGVDWSGLSRFFFFVWVSKILTFFKALWIVSTDKFDVVHEYSSSPVLFLRTFILSKICSAKSFHTIITNNSGFLSRAEFGVFGNLIDKLIFTSRVSAQKYSKFIEKDKIKILPFGIDIERFTLLKKPKTKNKVVLYLGPLETSKGVLLLAKSIREVINIYPATHFLFVFFRRTVRENEAKLLLDVKKQLVGLEGNYTIRNELVNVPKLFQTVDVVVIPQITAHGTVIPPLTLVEAMAAGKIVVAPNQPEIEELVEDEISGFVFANGNVKSLAHGISRGLMAKTQIGETAHNLIQSRYNSQINTKALASLYDQTS